MKKTAATIALGLLVAGCSQPTTPPASTPSATAPTVQPTSTPTDVTPSPDLGTPSTGPSGGPTVDPKYPAPKLPAGVTGDPAWTGAGTYITAWPDLIVTHENSAAKSAVNAYRADGTLAWHTELPHPEGTSNSSIVEVYRIAEKLMVFWGESGRTWSANMDPATGNLTPIEEQPNIESIMGQISPDTLEVRSTSREMLAVTLGADDKWASTPITAARDAYDLPDDAPGVDFAPASGPGTNVRVVRVSPERLVRFSQIDGKWWGQLLNAKGTKAAGPAISCSYDPTIIWSPQRHLIAAGAFLFELDKGTGECVDVETNGTWKPSALNDSGDILGRAFIDGKNYSYVVDHKGKIEKGPGDGAEPKAIIDQTAIFAIGEQGIMAYRR